MTTSPRLMSLEQGVYHHHTHNLIYYYKQLFIFGTKL